MSNPSFRVASLLDDLHELIDEFYSLVHGEEKEVDEKLEKLLTAFEANAYDHGRDDGYEDGSDAGYDNGYDDGYRDAREVIEEEDSVGDT